MVVATNCSTSEEISELEMKPKIQNVLSVQSSVCHGYVGNKVAMLPLQLLGYNVDPINTVQLSNHTGYDFFLGQRLGGKDIQDIIKGLKCNHLLNYDFVLSGYIGSVSFLNEFVLTLDICRKENRDLIYVCDPVLGDNGALYVPEEFVQIYRDKLVSQADLLLPNQTEAALLSEVNITDLPSAFAACNRLHKLGCKTIVITSLEIEDDKIHCVSSSVAPNSGSPERLAFSVAKLPGSFSGCGDLLSATLLAWYYRENDIGVAIENALATTQAVLRRTQRARSKDLLLVESIEDIAIPKNEMKPTIVKHACMEAPL